MEHIAIKIGVMLLVIILMLSGGNMILAQEADNIPASNQEHKEESAKEPSTEVTKEPTDKPNAETTEKPVDKPMEEPTEESVEKPTEQPTQEPTQEPAQEPTQEATEEPTEEPTEAPTEQPAQEPTVEPAEQPTDEANKEPIQEPVTRHRSVRVVTDGVSQARFGDSITLKGILSGYEGVNYALKWQRNTGNGWSDIPGANGEHYSFELNEQSITYGFRLEVTVTEKQTVVYNAGVNSLGVCHV